MNEEQRNRNEVFGGAEMMKQTVSTQQRINEELGFELPIATVALPSKGKVYPQESSLHMKEEVEIRAMTTRDEEILTSPALAKQGKSITELLKSCLTNKTINPEEMLSGDRNAILVFLRALSYGTDYEAEVECESCKTKQNFEFNINNIPIKSLEVEPVVPGENKFKVFLPQSKKEVVVKFLTGKDETEIAFSLEKLSKLGSEAPPTLTLRLKSAIVSVDGKTDKVFIDKFVRNMPARDARVIRKFLNENEPSLELKSPFVCRNCGEAKEVDIPLTAEFFLPS